MKKILVAEDEQAIREFVVINLRRAGYDTYEAETGDKALEIYERENGDIDVAVLDIMMPGNNDGFSPSELVARVDAVYRRVAMTESKGDSVFKEEIRSGNFALNLRNRSLMKDGTPIELTQVEFQIMEYFFSNPATALDRTEILRHVWGENYFGEEKIVDVNIRRLRMKIEDEPSNPKHIVTVWGLGYKWEA